MGKFKHRQSPHRKRKGLDEQDLSSSSESDYGTEESRSPTRKKKRRGRPSIIPDDAILDVGNDDLYPAQETRFKDWDTHIIANLEHQRDLGLSQADKNLWDSALEKMIKLRSIYNERKRTGREDVGFVQTAQKSTQTLRQVEDVGAQATFVNATERITEEVLNIAERGVGLMNGNEGSAEEGGHTDISIETKIEVDEDNTDNNVPRPHLTTVWLDDIGEDEDNKDYLSFDATSLQKKNNRQQRQFPNNTCSTSEKGNLVLARVRIPLKRLKNYKSGQGHAKSKTPAVEEPTQYHSNGDHELPSTSRNMLGTETPRISDEPSEGENHNLPNLPTFYIKRRLRALKGRRCFLSEDEFFNTVAENVTNTTIAIHGPSGMGKTTFLARIGRKLLHAFPTHKLFYLKMKKVAESVKAELQKRNVRMHLLNAEVVWSALQVLTRKSDLGNVSFNPNATSFNTTRTELFFDEFDLVPEEDRGLVYNILKLISTSIKSTSVRMWITSLSTDFSKIEKVLKSFEIYIFDPLDDASQVELIVSYWKMHTSKDKPTLHKFAKECVSKITARESNYDILALQLGNPLQCLLIGAACLRAKNSILSKNALISMPKTILAINYLIYENFLLDATLKRSFHTLKLILDLDKFDINGVDSYGNPPLFISIHCGIYSVDCLLKLKLLIKRGANLNYSNTTNDNLINYAAQCASAESFKYILSLNKFDIKSVNKNGSTPLLNSACNIDTLEKIKLLVGKGANLNHLNGNGDNLLVVAASHDSVETLKYILSLNKFDINCTDIDGDTPLFLSIHGRSDVDCLPKLKLLLEKGANLNHVNKNGSNLLLFAAEYGSIESLKYILGLNKFDINCVDNFGNTPLFLAVDGERRDVDCLAKVKFLIANGANLNHLNVNNDNFLFYVAQNASYEILHYGLTTGKYNINTKDMKGDSPLFLSLSNVKGPDCFKKFKLLVSRGANLDHANNNGSNVLHYAAKFASVSVLRYVINMDRFDINGKDNYGKNALNYANSAEALKRSDIKAKIKLLMEKGCISQ